MPFAVTQLPTEPIVLAQFDLSDINLEGSMQSIQGQIAHIASETPSVLVVLVDLRRQEIHFSDILLMVQHAQADPAGSLTDRRLRIALVGDHPLIEIATRKFNQILGINLGHLVTMDEALAWARDEIDRSRPAVTP